MTKTSPDLYKIFMFSKHFIIKLTKVVFVAVLIFALVLTSIISCSADSVNNSDYILFGLDWLRNKSPHAVYDPLSQYSDDLSDAFYDYYIHTKYTSDENVARYWNAYLSTYDYFNDYQPNVVMSYIGGEASEAGLDLTESAYKTSVMNRSQLAALADFGDNCLGNVEIRYNTLDGLSLRTANTIKFDGIAVSGSPLPHNFGTSYNQFERIGVYYNTTVAQSNNYANYVSVYGDGQLPPAIYIPRNCVVYQGSGTNALPYGFYIILGVNSLLRVNYNDQSYRTLYYYNPGSTVNSIKFGIGQCPVSVVTNDGMQCSYHSESMPIYENGENMGNTNAYISGYDLTQLIQMLHGYQVGQTPPDPIIYDLPDDIPYDDDGNVTVMIPYDIDDHSITYGDIVYMSNDEYNDYVNNGTIVEGDYINDYSTNTNNNISSTYYNYVINNNSTFDDSNILAKLDVIIGKLNDIISKIGTSTQTFLDETGEIFSGEPVYTDFGDCITENLPIVSDVKNMLENLNPQQSISIESAVVVDGAVADSNPYKSFMNGFRLDLSWYEPYRIKFRNLMKIACYISDIGSIYAVIKSVFGVHSGGE